MKKWVTGNGERVRGFLRIPHPASRNPGKGLTLIEVMVVVAILAVISSTLFSVFQSGLFSQRKGTNKALVYSEARAALEMMSREIEKAMVDERIPLECLGQNGSGAINDRADTFLFFAPLNPNNSGGKYKAELCEMGFWVDVNNQELIRNYETDNSIDFDLDTRNNWGVLIGNVYDLQFEYFDGLIWTTGTIYEGLWDDFSGKPVAVLPRAIKITLVMQYESEKDEEKQDTFITIVNIPGSGQ